EEVQDVGIDLETILRELEAMTDEEVGLLEPRSAAEIAAAERIELRGANVHDRRDRRTAANVLIQAKSRTNGERVADLRLELMRAIGRQFAGVRLAIGTAAVRRVHRFDEVTPAGDVRLNARSDPVAASLVLVRQAGVIAAQAAEEVGGMEAPPLRKALRGLEFEPIVLAGGFRNSG